MKSLCSYKDLSKEVSYNLRLFNSVFNKRQRELKIVQIDS